MQKVVSFVFMNYFVFFVEQFGVFDFEVQSYIINLVFQGKMYEVVNQVF